MQWTQRFTSCTFCIQGTRLSDDVRVYGKHTLQRWTGFIYPLNTRQIGFNQCFGADIAVLQGVSNLRQGGGQNAFRQIIGTGRLPGIRSAIAK